LLIDFPSSKLPLDKLLNLLRPLLPRFYSISSTQLANPSRVSITVAIVRYNTYGRERKGVTTTYLSDRVKNGDLIPVYINKNPDFRLPDDINHPILMIGPGTGVAPFRAFMHERVLKKSAGKNILYFGCRHRDEDFLYRTELEDYQNNNQLTLHTAFSREQTHKIYVQHRIRENSKAIWQLIQEENAHIYVCGDAQNMAGEVNEVLEEIIVNFASGIDPKQYLLNLEKDKRYQRDIWF